jgi:hypothetical protein
MIGEKVPAPVCVINEQRCFTEKAEQLRTKCVGRRSGRSIRYSVVENDDIDESGGYWKFNEEVLEPNVYALKQQRGGLNFQ